MVSFRVFTSQPAVSQLTPFKTQEEKTEVTGEHNYVPNNKKHEALGRLFRKNIKYVSSVILLRNITLKKHILYMMHITSMLWNASQTDSNELAPFGHFGIYPAFTQPREGRSPALPPLSWGPDECEGLSWGWEGGSDTSWLKRHSSLGIGTVFMSSWLYLQCLSQHLAQKQGSV